MTWSRETFNRWFVALAAAACFAASGVIAGMHPDEQFWWGGFLRAGIVLVALWFCLPGRIRPAAWQGLRPLPMLLVATSLLLVIVRPRIGLPLLIGVLAWVGITNRVRQFFRPTRRRTTGSATGHHRDEPQSRTGLR